jgi:hypothetical protein
MKKLIDAEVVEQFIKYYKEEYVGGDLQNKLPFQALEQAVLDAKIPDRIEFGEGCFGPDVTIDLVEVIDIDNDEDNNISKDTLKARLKLLQLVYNSDSYMVWLDLCEVVNDYNYTVLSDSYDSCEQCGNPNWNKIFINEKIET